MDKIQIWNQVLEKLGEKISRMEFCTWFKKVHLKEVSGDLVLISCPTEMNKNWLESKFLSLILSNVQKVLPEIRKIMFEVDLTLGDKPSMSPQVFTDSKKSRKLPKQPEVRLESGFESRIIQSKFTLQNFVVGEESQLAHAACMSVAETDIKSPKRYNPLYVYGGVGLGKTHLLQGTANEIFRRNPEAIVIYTTAERFTNEIVKAIREQKTEILRRKYRKVDVLLIDDVQFFEGKEQTQVEVFNTFNDLRDMEKQMIFSADRPPSQLEQIMDRLTSRLGWGLVVDIQMPNFETKVAIIQEKAQIMGLVLPEEIQTFIANNIRKNLRELENVLNKISIEIEVSRISPTVQSVGKIFRMLNPHEEIFSSSITKTTIITIDDVIDCVADYFHVSVPDILGNSRKKEIMLPRQLVWYLCKKFLRMSFNAIGNSFGGKNHTTIMHGIRKIETLIREDSMTARNIHALKRELGVK